MSHNRYPAEVKQRALHLSLDSGLSAAQVAQEVGCSIHTIHAWRKQFREQNGHVAVKRPRKRTSPPSVFIPVNLVDAKSASVEIVTPSGYTLRLSDASTQYIVELLTALGSC